jgi:hypothetical protein
MSAPSKNQRAGKRSVQPVLTCSKGHVKTWCNIAARGRKNMQALCECDGYTPIRNERQK